MTDQISITEDKARMTFTEHGLAEALRDTIEALYGEVDVDPSEIANVIFIAATIETRDSA